MVNGQNLAERLRSMNRTYVAPQQLAARHMEAIEKECLRVAENSRYINYRINYHEWEVCGSLLCDMIKDNGLSLSWRVDDDCCKTVMTIRWIG